MPNLNWQFDFFIERVFVIEIWKNEHLNWILHIRISLRTRFQIKLKILIFGPNLLKKGILGLKQKNLSFACAHGRYLLY